MATPEPGTYQAMLATLTDDRFDDPDWIYERKLDGVRVLAYLGDEVALLSRNEESMNAAYPELVEALKGQVDAVVDGEIVAFEGDVTSFAKLQARIHVNDPEEARQTGVEVFLYLFDILWLDGEELIEEKLRERKSRLREAFDFEDPIRFVPHRNEEGVEYWKSACERGWEGVIAKDAGASYVQSRSKKWLKFKCVNRQELVIVGFTEPEGERIGFGALLVGYYDGDDLCYAGKVGTGFDDEFLESMRERFDEIEVAESPLAEAVDDDDVHFVEPRLVAEIGFTEWTDAGKLRHPRFIGLREDKDSEDVVREVPQ